MRIDREEKRSLKKLFVGILVMALLVTMVPYGDIGNVVVRAADETTGEDIGVEEGEEGVEPEVETSDLQNMDPFSTETPVITIEKYNYTDETGTIQSATAEEAFAEEIGNVSKGTYDEFGVILKLKEDLVFEGVDVNGLLCGNIGIDMNGHSINGLKVLEANSLNGYESGLVFYGTGKKNEVVGFEGSYWTNEIGEVITEPEQWYLYGGQRLVFLNVDVQNVQITMEQGYERPTAFGYNDFYHELPGSDETENTSYVITYDSTYGGGLYQLQNDDYNVVNVEDMFFIEGVKEFDVTAALGMRNYIYPQNVVDSMPEDLKLIYDNGVYIGTYDVPSEEFYVDDNYGVFSVSDDELTIYALYINWDNIEIVDIDSENTGEANSPILERISINEGYSYDNGLDEDGNSIYTFFKHVFFEEGSIPATNVVMSSKESGQDMYYKIEEILFEQAYWVGTDEIEYTFNMTNRENIEIWNYSGAGVSIVDQDASAKNAVWVPFNIESNGISKCNVEKFETKGHSNYSGLCAKAGDIVTLSVDNTPDGKKQTIYNVQLGSWEYGVDENNNTLYDVYSYEYGRRADIEKHVAFCTNGEVQITVPNFASRLDVTVGEVQNIEEYETYLTFKPEGLDGMDTWYIDDFCVNVKEFAENESYIICDASTVAADTNGWKAEGIPVTEEGKHIKGFYLLDKTMLDESTPAETYGQISYVEYAYTMDKDTPKITTLNAVDAAGEVFETNGGWYDKSVIIEEPLWTNQESVTLTVTADKGNGLNVAGYEFIDGNSIIQESNIYTVSGDGVHELVISAIDEFDQKISELEEAGNSVAKRARGAWTTTIGIDTTAPIIQFTDAKNATSSELKSNGSYEGNLHIIGMDDTVTAQSSGIKEIHLYKKNGDTWSENNNLLVETESGYYIAPTTTNEVYRLEIIDNVDNKTVYDNITVVGYVQDVEVSVGKETGIYGEELIIPVTITNTSENTLEITLFALREDATDDVFAQLAEKATEIKAGETFTTNLCIPKGADAATYEAMFDLAYISKGGSLEKNVAKVYSHHINAIVEQAEGTGTVIVEDFYYGENLEPKVESVTNGTEKVTLYYKEKDAEDSTYTQNVPTKVGSYVVKAVYSETTNYKEVVAIDEFTITRMNGTTSMYTISASKNEDGVYKEDVIIKGVDGVLLSLTEDGKYTESLTISETTENVTFYMKTTSGAVTEKVELGKIVIDKVVADPEVKPVTIDKGAVQLERGTAYKLGTGTWKVTGDSTNYTGGTIFYVPTNGNYEFTQEQ